MDKKNLQIKIGKRIKLLRENNNISQQELAFLCDFEKSNMSRIEAGNTNPTIYTIYKIAKALDDSLSFLLNIHEGN